MGVLFTTEEKDFSRIREFCLVKLGELFNKNGNLSLFTRDTELWTPEKGSEAFHMA